MHIAMISPYPSAHAQPRGGVEVSTVRLVEELTARGVEVSVISTGAPERETRSGIAIYRAMARRLTTARLLRPWRADVRRILGSLDFDLVHGQGLMPPGLAATDVSAERYGRIVTAHGNRRRDALAEYSGLGAVFRSVLVDRLSAVAARRADIVIGVHPDWRVNVPVQPRRFVFIPNIVDEVFFGAERRPDAGRVLYCGGPGAIKGWELLMRAWPEVLEAVPSAKLEAAGWRAGKPDPRHIVPGAEIRGWLSAHDLCSTMERADVIVVPSRFEVAPVLVAEAWAAGVPIVAASVGGLASLAEGAAVLTERNPMAVARAIVDVLLRRVDVDLLVDEGRSRAEASRGRHVVDAHLDVYRKLGASLRG